MENDRVQNGLQMESLQGQFLLATPQMPDPRFREQIIFICSHNADGAMGFVVNQPSPYTMREIYDGAGLQAPKGELPFVYIGGPVEMAAVYFLFSVDYTPFNYLNVTKKVRISADSDILVDISEGRGPADYIFLLGYAGWGPGQLEAELTTNGWITLPAEYDDIFHTPDSRKWKNVAARHGIDMVLFGDVIGNA